MTGPQQHGVGDPDRSDHVDRDPTMGDVCWLAATCDECGALVEGGTCWNCGAVTS